MDKYFLEEANKFEQKKWQEKSYKELIKTVTEKTQIYESSYKDISYEVEFYFLEKNDRYIHFVVEVMEGALYSKGNDIIVYDVGVVEIYDPRKNQEFWDWDREYKFSSIKDNYFVVKQDNTCLENYEFILEFLNKFNSDYLSLLVLTRNTFFKRNNRRLKISNFLEKESINQYYYNHFESEKDMIEKLVLCYKEFGGYTEWTFCGYKEENAKKVQALKFDGEWPTDFDFLKHIELYEYIFHSNLDMSWWSIYFKDESFFDDFLQFINSYKEELEKQ